MKRCTKCGKRKKRDAFQKDSSKSTGLRFECKTCASTRNRGRYATDSRYRRRKTAIAKKWANANPERRKSYTRNCMRRQCQSLSDAYIRAKIAHRSGIPCAAIPKELVEAKREQLKLHRLLKEKQKC